MSEQAEKRTQDSKLINLNDLGNSSDVMELIEQKTGIAKLNQDLQESRVEVETPYEVKSTSWKDGMG